VGARFPGAKERQRHGSEVRQAGDVVKRTPGRFITKFNVVNVDVPPAGPDAADRHTDGFQVIAVIPRAFTAGSQRTDPRRAQFLVRGNMMIPEVLRPEWPRHGGTKAGGGQPRDRRARALEKTAAMQLRMGRG